MYRTIHLKVFILLTVLSASAFLNVVQGGGPAWIEREKIRSYWGPPVELIEPLHEAGFNVIIQRLELAVNDKQRAEDQKVNVEGYNFEQAEQILTESSALCKRLGMRYFFCLNLGAMPHIIQEGFKDNPRRCEDGVRPCPLDELYWNRIITNRFKKATELLEGERYRIDGFIIDPEMYAFPSTIMTLPCYCKTCITEFASENPKAAALVDADDKAGWLVQYGLAKDFEDRQFNRMCALVKEIEKAIHSKRPELVLGFAIWENSLWFKALAAGLSSESIPVMIIDEMPTYSGAYDDSYTAYQQTLAKQVPVPFINCPGIWINRNTGGDVPEKLLEVIPGNLYHRTIRADGYFLYASDRWGGTRQSAAPFTAVFKMINAELDKYLKSEGTYQSSWQPKPLPVVPPANLRSLLVKAQTWSLVREPNTAVSTLSVPHLRESEGPTHIMIFKAKKGDSVLITMTTSQLGHYIDKGSMSVFAPDASSIGEVTCECNKSASYEMNVTQDGAYAVIATANSNAYAIDITGAPWMIVSPTIKLNRVGGRLFFFVSRDMKTLSASLGGGGEKADFTLYDPNGSAMYSKKAVEGPEIVELPVTDKSGIWAIEIANIEDDTLFSIKGIDHYAVKASDLMIDEE